MKNTGMRMVNGTTYRFAAIAVFFAMFLSVLPIAKVDAAGTISGTIYIDYNMNGARDTSGTAPTYAVDAGIGGVTITAYDSSGTQRGTTTSNANGSYSLSATGTGPYRLELTNLPSGYNPSAVGTNNSSSVRFVPDGTSTGIDFGIVKDCEYCQDNPLMVTPQFINGNNIAAGDSLVAFRYDASGSLLSFGDTDDTGSAWGLAWRSKDRKLLVSSVLKRHSGFGPGKDGIRNNADDMRTIYVYDYSNPGTNGQATINTSQAIDLGLLGIDVGTNPRLSSTPANDLGTPTQPNHDYDVFTEVGKRGIGGITLSEDENTLYVVNLNSAQRQLVSLNVSDLSNVTLNNTYSIPNPGCAAGDYYAPWAVREHQGQPYIGVVCTADVSQNYSNLRAYLLRLDGSTFTTVDLDSTSANTYISLTYDRTFGYAGAGGGGASGRAEWRPWLNSFPTNIISTYNKSYATPIFSDMEFHADGSLSIGLMDRSGHQIGYGNYAEAQSNTNLYDYISAGDVLKVCNSGGNFIPEGNAGCSQPTAGIYDAATDPGATPPEIAGVPNEFYNDSSLTGGSGSDGHLETFFGGMGAVPGVNELAMVQMNPLATYHAGGFRWVSTTNGAAFRNYTVYQNPNSSSTNSTYGKSNGLGDIEMLCNAAPLQVGNRVWNDTNGNGVQDPNEASIQGVTLQLWADTDSNGTVDTQVGTATTDVNGNYIFGGINNTNLSTYSCGTTTGTVNAKVNASNNDAYQPAITNIVNTTDTRTQIGGAVSATGVRFTNLSIPQGATITNAYIQFYPNNTGNVNTGTPSITIRGDNVDNASAYSATLNNITSRPDTSAFQTWTISATWANNGSAGADHRTPDLSGIVQEIVNRSGWSSGNAMAFTLIGSGTTSRRDAESYDGTTADSPELVVEYSVPTVCTYSVDPNTAYEVRIPPSNFSGGALSGFSPTVPDNDGSANGDLRDSDGIVLSGNEVIAQFVTGSNAQNNHTYDFGFRTGSTVYSLGNRVWYDTDDDGIIDAGEVGKSGVSVSIFLDSNTDGLPDTPASPINTVTTNANGYYRFDSLAAGNYVVRLNPANFQSGGTLVTYANTTGINTANVESSGASSNAENGVNPTVANGVLTSGILSNTITLGPGQPTGEADVPASGTFAGQGSLDNQANVTIDLGFYKLSLSGTVWNDNGNGTPANNNNGQLDASENRLGGYTVQLYDSLGNEISVGPDGILGTADDAPGGMNTDASGDYNFQGLATGTYRVVLTQGGATSSTPTESDPDLNVDHNDNGFPDNTGNYPGKIISGIVTLTPGNAGAANNNTVNNAEGSTANPTVDFGLILAPTLVEMDKMEAFFDGGNVVVEWSTGDESANLGFNVYREVSGQKELITQAPVAGSGLKTTVEMEVKGNNYRWIDRQSKLGAVYYIEDIDFNGNRTMHGPVRPDIRSSLDYSRQNSSSKLLSDLVRSASVSPQKEFLREVSSADENPVSSGLSDAEFAKQKAIAAMPGVKLFVKETGWYRVDVSELAQRGFDINTNSQTWQLFVNGGEVPMQIGQNPDGGQTIEFYGEGIETNLTDAEVYYLVNGSQAGRRLSEVKGEAVSGDASADGYEVTVQRKDRMSYVSLILNGEKENWFGPLISSNNATHQDLILSNPHNDGVSTARLRVRLQGLTLAEHLVSVSFNGTQLGTVDYSNRDNEEFEFEIPMSSIIDGQNRVSLRSVGAGSDLSLVDTVSVRYTRSYTAKDDLIHFSVPANQSVRVGGFSEADIRVFEINSGEAVREVVVESEKVNGKPGFSLIPANYDREFIAFRNSGYSRNVAGAEANYPSAWNNPKNKAGFIILTPKVFRAEAEDLAQRRRSQGWNTTVVEVEDVYDEYGFGKRSTEAIRNFLEDASTNWTVKPNYVLLFGDSSYDHKNYLGQDDRDFIPTRLIDTEFMETASDVWLADFDNDGVENLAIGRLPVGNNAEAVRMLEKLQRYDQQTARTQNTDLLVADNFFESFSNELEGRLPQGASAMKINRSQMSDAQMRSEILNKIKLDPMVVTYSGHGAAGLWASNSVFNNLDAATLKNNKLAFFMLMTCLNGYSHNPYTDSLSEVVMKADNGAIATWASSGSTYASGQIFMSLRATQDLFDVSSNPQPIGDITRAAKQTTNDLDARRTWQLFGDPTVVIR